MFRIETVRRVFQRNVRKVGSSRVNFSSIQTGQTEAESKMLKVLVIVFLPALFEGIYSTCNKLTCTGHLTLE